MVEDILEIRQYGNKIQIKRNFFADCIVSGNYGKKQTFILVKNKNAVWEDVTVEPLGTDYVNYDD